MVGDVWLLLCKVGLRLFQWELGGQEEAALELCWAGPAAAAGELGAAELAKRQMSPWQLHLLHKGVQPGLKGCIFHCFSQRVCPASTH